MPGTAVQLSRLSIITVGLHTLTLEVCWTGGEATDDSGLVAFRFYGWGISACY